MFVSAPMTAEERRDAMQRTFAAAFSALADFSHKSPSDADEVYATIVAHVRSARPQALLTIDTGPVPLVNDDGELARLRAEIEKLTAENDLMRPAYVASLADEPDCECAECATKESDG